MNREFIEKVTEWTKRCLEHQLTEKEIIELYPQEDGIIVNYRRGCKHKKKKFNIDSNFSAKKIKKFCRSAMNREERIEYSKNYYRENSDLWSTKYNYDDGNYIYYYKIGKKIVYIGETDNLKTRIRNHTNDNGNNDLYENYILDNYDWEMYVSVLPDEFTKWERKFIEKILIEKYNTKTNRNTNRSHLNLTGSRQEELRKLADELEFVKVFTEECCIC